MIVSYGTYLNGGWDEGYASSVIVILSLLDTTLSRAIVFFETVFFEFCACIHTFQL